MAVYTERQDVKSDIAYSGDIFTGITGTVNGGALYISNHAEVTAAGCTFSQNQLTEPKYGAGIYLYSGALEVTGTLFLNNVSNTSSGTSGGGAACLKSGTAEFSGSTFTGNTARHGSALYNDGSAMTVSGSYFYSNYSTGGTGAIRNAQGMLTIGGCTFAGNGVAVRNEAAMTINGLITLGAGDTIRKEAGTITVDGSSFFDGTEPLSAVKVVDANAANWLSGDGTLAASAGYTLFTDTADNDLYIVNSTEVVTGAGIVSAGGSLTRVVINGVMYVGTAYNSLASALAAKSNIAVTDYQWTSGAQVSAGGKNLVLGDRTVISGLTGTRGAVVQLYSGNVTFSGATVIGNTSSGNGGVTDNGNNASTGNVTAVNSLFANNAADTVKSGTGGVFNAGASGVTLVNISGSTFAGNTARQGGVLYTSNAQVTVSDSLFINNTASLQGGALRIAGTAKLTIGGSTFSGNGTGAIDGDKTAAVTINGTIWLNGNDTLSCPGGITVDAAAVLGGQWFGAAVDASAKGVCGSGDSSWRTSGTLSTQSGYSLIQDQTGCYAVAGEYTAASFISSSNAHALEIGGVRYAGTLTGFDRCGGTAPTSIGSAMKLAVVNARVSENTNTGNGGAFFLNGGVLIFSGSTVSGNFLGKQSGAGVYVSSGTLLAENTLFTGNYVETASGGGAGGALYVASGSVRITGSTFSGNTARNGGAIYNNGGSISIRDSYFTGNVCGNVGAAIRNAAGTMELSGATFADSIYNESTITVTGLITLLSGNINNKGTITVDGASFIQGTDFAFAKVVDAAASGWLSGSAITVTDGYYLKNVGNDLYVTNKDAEIAAIVSNGGTASSVQIDGVYYAGTSYDSLTTALAANSRAAVTGYTWDAASVSLNGKELFVGNGTVISGMAGDRGGVVRLFSGSVTFDGAMVSGNSAVSSGGAVDNGNSYSIGNVTAKNTIFDDNHAGASSTGGAICIGGNTVTQVVIDNCTFSRNTAKHGGAIYGNLAAMTITDSLFSNNSVSGTGAVGGAIRTNGTLTIGNTTFSGNGTSALYNQGTMTIIGTIYLAAGDAINTQNGTVTIDTASMFADAGTWFAAAVSAADRQCGTSAGWLSGTITAPGAGFSAISDNTGYFVVKGEYTAAGMVSSANIHAKEINGVRYAGVRYADTAAAFAAGDLTVLADDTSVAAVEIGTGKSLLVSGGTLGAASGAGSLTLADDAALTGNLAASDITFTAGSYTLNTGLTLNTFTAGAGVTLKLLGGGYHFTSQDCSGTAISVDGTLGAVDTPYLIADGLTAAGNFLIRNQDNELLQTVSTAGGTAALLTADTAYVGFTDGRSGFNCFQTLAELQAAYPDYTGKVVLAQDYAACGFQWTEATCPQSITVGGQQLALTWGVNAFNTVEAAAAVLANADKTIYLSAQTDSDHKTFYADGRKICVLGGAANYSYIYATGIAGSTVSRADISFTGTTMGNYWLGKANALVAGDFRVSADRVYNTGNWYTAGGKLGAGGNYSAEITDSVIVGGLYLLGQLVQESAAGIGGVTASISGSTVGSINFNASEETMQTTGISLTVTDSVCGGISTGNRAKLTVDGDIVITLSGATVNGHVCPANRANVTGSRSISITDDSTVNGDIYYADALTIASGKVLDFGGGIIAGNAPAEGPAESLQLTNNGTIRLHNSPAADSTITAVVRYQNGSSTGTITADAGRYLYDNGQGIIYLHTGLYVDSSLTGEVGDEVQITVGGATLTALYGINAFSGSDAARKSGAAQADAKTTLTILNETFANNFYGNGTTTLFAGGTVTKTTYGGKLIKENGNVGDSSLTITGGTFASMVVGGSRVSVAGTSAAVTGGTAALNISGGSFASHLIAAGYVINTGDAGAASLTMAESDLTLANITSDKYAFGGAFVNNGTASVGTVNAAVTSGTYKSVFGGGWAQKGTSSVGTANLTVSGGSIHNLYAGGTDNGEGNAATVTTANITISGGEVRNVFLNGKYSRDTVTTATLNVTEACEINWIEGLCHSMVASSKETQTAVNIGANLTVEDILHVDEWNFNTVGTLLDFGTHTADLNGTTEAAVDTVIDFQIGKQELETPWTAVAAQKFEGLKQSSVEINGQAASAYAAETNTWTFGTDYTVTLGQYNDTRKALIVTKYTA